MRVLVLDEAEVRFETLLCFFLLLLSFPDGIRRFAKTGSGQDCHHKKQTHQKWRFSLSALRAWVRRGSVRGWRREGASLTAKSTCARCSSCGPSPCARLRRCAPCKKRRPQRGRWRGVLIRLRFSWPWQCVTWIGAKDSPARLLVFFSPSPFPAVSLPRACLGKLLFSSMCKMKNGSVCGQAEGAAARGGGLVRCGT